MLPFLMSQQLLETEILSVSMLSCPPTTAAFPFQKPLSAAPMSAPILAPVAASCLHVMPL